MIGRPDGGTQPTGETRRPEKRQPRILTIMELESDLAIAKRIALSSLAPDPLVASKSTQMQFYTRYRQPISGAFGIGSFFPIKTHVLRLLPRFFWPWLEFLMIS